MHHPLAYALGTNAASRAARLRERMLKTAEKDHRCGLPPRLCFLKKYLCGQDVPDCFSKPDNAPHYQEGAVIPIRYAEGATSARDAMRDISRFNKANAAAGLQAVVQTPGKGEAYRFLVTRCRTTTIGDLLLSESLLRPNAGSDGHYHVPLHQVFVYASVATSSFRSIVKHECEHAAHLSLWWLADLPLLSFSRRDMEYLSMLVPLRDGGDTEIIYRCHVPRGSPKRDRRCYRGASCHFISNLQQRYGMTDGEIIRGLHNPEDGEALRFAELMGETVGPDDARHHMRLRECAALEYDRTYNHLFGLPINAIREIILGLPLF